MTPQFDVICKAMQSLWATGVGPLPGPTYRSSMISFLVMSTNSRWFVPNTLGLDWVSVVKPSKIDFLRGVSTEKRTHIVKKTNCDPFSLQFHNWWLETWRTFFCYSEQFLSGRFVIFIFNRIPFHVYGLNVQFNILFVIWHVTLKIFNFIWRNYHVLTETFHNNEKLIF